MISYEVMYLIPQNLSNAYKRYCVCMRNNVLSMKSSKVPGIEYKAHLLAMLLPFVIYIVYVLVELGVLRVLWYIVA